MYNTDEQTHEDILKQELVAFHLGNPVYSVAIDKTQIYDANGKQLMRMYQDMISIKKLLNSAKNIADTSKKLNK